MFCLRNQDITDAKAFFYLFFMSNSGSFINSMDLNWGFVEEIYKENFKENIVWDTQIYKLIEKSK